MQAEVMSDAEKLADYPKQVERGNYWKTEHDKIVLMREKEKKDYKMTISAKDKRIKALEEQLYLRKQGSLFK